MLDIYTKDDSESFRPFAIKKKIIRLSSCHLYILKASLQIRANQGLKELRSSVLIGYPWLYSLNEYHFLHQSKIFKFATPFKNIVS